MYVYICMCVCLLMKGSISFDPNNAKLTLKIHDCSGRVNSYIGPKTVLNWLKNHFFKKWYVAMKSRTTCFS